MRVISSPPAGSPTPPAAFQSTNEIRLLRAVGFDFRLVYCITLRESWSSVDWTQLISSSILYRGGREGVSLGGMALERAFYCSFSFR